MAANIFSITDHQEHANQSHQEISLHSRDKGCQCCREGKNVIGNASQAVIEENSVKKMKNSHPLRSATPCLETSALFYSLQG